MRDLQAFEECRVPLPARASIPGRHAYILPSPIDGGSLKVVASKYAAWGWEHVTVSRVDRCPRSRRSRLEMLRSGMRLSRTVIA